MVSFSCEGLGLSSKKEISAVTDGNLDALYG
jgi:hypothetical protein